MFQSLVGTLKTLQVLTYIGQAGGVSIPRRYAKNIPWAAHFSNLVHVSIPRRYAKNDEKHKVYEREFEMFQSLVGTLKTFPSSPMQRFFSMFQSLVGTLKTYSVL